MSEVRAHFDVDSYMRIDDQVYRVVKQLDTGRYVLENIDNACHETWDVSDLLTAIQEGRCRPNYPLNRSPLKTDSDISDPYDTLEEWEKRVVRDDYTFVDAAKTAGYRHRSKLQGIVDRVWTTRTFEVLNGKPSVHAVETWIRKYDAEGLFGLAPKHQRKGNREYRYPHDIYPVIDEILDKEKRQHPDANDNYLLGQLHKGLEERGWGQRLQIDKIAISVVRRWRNSRSKKRDYADRHGWQAAKRVYAPRGGILDPRNVLESVEIDFKNMPVRVSDPETREYVGCPILTAIVDVYSGMPLGIDLSFSPDSGAALRCSRHAMLPKFDLVDEDGVFLTHRDWDCHGVPMSITPDRDQSFLSHAFRDAYFSVRTDIELPFPYAPQQKSVVERFFGTLETKLVPTLPGYVPPDRWRETAPGSGPQKLLTLKELYVYLVRWIVDIFGSTPNEATGEPPLDRFKQGAKTQPPRPIERRQLVSFLPYRSTRKLERRGVKIQNVYYFNKELVKLIGDTRINTSAPEITVFYDDDMDDVWAFDPVEQTYRELRVRKRPSEETTDGPSLSLSEEPPTTNTAEAAEHDIVRETAQLADDADEAARAGHNAAQTKNGKGVGQTGSRDCQEYDSDPNDLGDETSDVDHEYDVEEAHTEADGNPDDESEQSDPWKPSRDADFV